MHHRLLGTDPTAVAGGDALVLLTRAALRAAAVTAVAIVLVAASTRGTAGALTALGTTVGLVGLHVGSGLVTARLSRHDPQAMPAITMVALLVRLAVYGLLVALLGDVAAVDVPVLAVTVVALTAAMLGGETWLVARYSRFWWQTTTPPASAREMERTEA